MKLEKKQKKRKICVVVTARASYSRIKSALLAIDKHPDLQLQLVVAASALLEKYGSVVDVIKADGLKIDAKVYMVIEGENLVTSAKTTGVGIVELATIFDNLKPDMVLSIADRYETIATAITASFMNIPVIHVQGGEVTGSIDEKVRHAVTKLSNLHFVSNESSYNRVIKMGESKGSVFITGCPSIDLAKDLISGKQSINHEDLKKGVGALLNPDKEYIMVMQHSVTLEWKGSEYQMNETLNAIDEIGIQCYWFWPNVDAGSDSGSKAIRAFRESGKGDNIRFIKNLPPEEFLILLLNSKCMVGNSSVGIRESSFLGVPVVNIGSRQKGRDRGSNVIDVEHSRSEILGAIKQQISHGHYPSESIYGDGGSGTRIADILSRVELVIDKKITY
jgi:UDP-hydrolysing UDP-N-acetyl-D-glucosamine 2-epimerase